MMYTGRNVVIFCISIAQKICVAIFLFYSPSLQYLQGHLVGQKNLVVQGDPILKQKISFDSHTYIMQNKGTVIFAPLKVFRLYLTKWSHMGERNA